jgi:hypothetical protein
MAKNTHLEHLEDDILNQGSQGGKNAIEFLRSLGKMLTEKNSTGIMITTKWDGAPAIVCGTNPENGKFFVGTKSVFAKTEPKLCYTNQDITNFYGEEGQLVNKLRTCLQYLPRIGINGVLQGDLLFTNDRGLANINGKNMITFRPNTITYAVPRDTDLGSKVSLAKMGIVFHTRYTGNTIAEMNASFGVDINSFNNNQDVYVATATFRDATGAANFSTEQLTAYNAAVNRAEGSLRQASTFLDILGATGESKFLMTSLFKRYFNTYIVSGQGVKNTQDVSANFSKFYVGLLDKEILSKKTKTAQDKYLKMKQDGLQFIEANKRAIYMTVASYINLQTAKGMVINQLAKVNTFGTFLKTDDGYKVTAPEGFVAIKSGSALKLVDRLEFSRANFTVAKDWDK